MTSSPQHQLPIRHILTTRRRQPAQEAQSRSRSSITIRATRSPAAASSSTCPSHGTAVSQLGQCTLTTGRLVSSSLLSPFRYPVGNAIQSRLTSPSSWIGYSVSQLLAQWFMTSCHRLLCPMGPSKSSSRQACQINGIAGESPEPLTSNSNMLLWQNAA